MSWRPGGCGSKARRPSSRATRQSFARTWGDRPMPNRSGRHSVPYWKRATSELYGVIREQAPPELEPTFLESEDPAEARAKLARAEFVIIADWTLTTADVEGAPRLRMVQHQGVGYERIDTA